MSGDATAPAGTMRLVVLGWGNESRGDDGLGPALTRRIEALGLAHVTTIEDFQLQLEHAVDLDGADLALFLDASVAAPAPFAFTETGPRAGLTHTSHAMVPEAVLDVFSRVMGRTPPPAFVLAVRGDAFELGTGLGEAATARLEAAWAFVRPLIEAPDLAAWRAALTA
jgi:hydrogenase maturation protease